MILIYGGSFNPPTIAHQAILEKLNNLYPEAKIIVVPVGDDYRKNDLAPFFHRVEMVKLMIESYDSVILSTIEGVHPFHGTIGTLNILEKTYQDLYIVIGQDQLETIHTWIRSDELIKKYPFIIMKRNGHMNEVEFQRKYSTLKDNFTFIDFNMDISATMFRVNPHHQMNLIPQNVNEYINKHQLYKE
ncbi:MAG: nicotinate (nicotinamide) nucleotide adenylyltransferase [Acholeplasmataceae bacterium]|nr:nicotinate (nicotinamide) nucleotide adenylyltransferase [Acholeplasmataceae bacterium]